MMSSLRRGAPTVRGEVREVVRWFVQVDGDWRQGNRDGGSELGRRSWRWRYAFARCGQSKGEREGMERVVESVVHAAEATVLGA
jgi:hypothetical protein